MRILATILLALPLFLGAATWHVSTTGDDAHSGLADSPWRSIDRGQPTALRVATSPGDRVVHVVKAIQLPSAGSVTIAGRKVSYTGRTLQTLTGCDHVPEARAGELVTSLDWLPPQPGDTVLVESGTWWLPCPAAPETTTAGQMPLAVVIIRAGGSAEAPVVFKAAGKVVVDGRDRKLAWLIDHAPFVTVDGFEVRRGGISAGWSGGARILHCDVHEGPRGIHAYYSDDVEIAWNRIHDLIGAWTSPGISLGPGNRTRAHHNTVVACGTGMRGYLSGDRRIDHNLVAWCRRGIAFDKPAACQLASNNVWACGWGIWLQRDDNEGRDWYENVGTPPTTDRHVDPEIVEWNSQLPHFLAPLQGRDMDDIGAVPPAARPASLAAHYVQNGSFESGLLGWMIDYWVGFQPGQAHHNIVETPGAEGRRCLHLVESPAKGQRINTRVMSEYIRYPRGGRVTISLRAKAARAGTRLGIGLTVPSWQNKSGVHEQVSLTTDWATYTVTLAPTPRFPDWAAVTMTLSAGEYWLDAVQLPSGQPPVELIPNLGPGRLTKPGVSLKGQLYSRLAEPATIKWHYSLEAPLRGELLRNERKIAVKPGLQPVELPLPGNLTGVLLLRYSFGDDPEQTLRFLIGEPVNRHSDFIGATPPYGAIDLAHWNEQVQALANLGVGTLHLYAGMDRLQALIDGETFRAMLASTEPAGLSWLLTPSDAKALVGERAVAVDPDHPELDTRQRQLAEGLPRFTRQVASVAQHYRGRIRYWELLNEPNCFLDGTGYTQVATSMSTAIRREDPRATIIAGSIVNAPRQDVWQAAMDLPPGTFDAFSFHPYRFGLKNPESENASFRQSFQWAREDLASHHQPTALFPTEQGMGSTFDETRCIGIQLTHSAVIRRSDWGEGELRQALYGIRMYLTARGEGAIGYNYHTLNGMVNDSLNSPNLFLAGLFTVATRLNGAAPLGRLPLNDELVGYLFVRDTTPWWPGGTQMTAVVYPRDAEYSQPAQVTLPAAPRFKAWDLFGHALPTVDSVTLDRGGLYLVWPESSSEDATRTLTDLFRDVSLPPCQSPTR